jgi:hypothetical protein
MFANWKIPSPARAAWFTIALWSLVFVALGVAYVVIDLEPSPDADSQAHSVIFLAISFVFFEGPTLIVALVIILVVELFLLRRLRRGRRPTGASE